ncbi:MAG: hypothetical protein HRU40_17225 [Saprospiraceae bacterium]|nr:hypothetical protein [Saprospiraceae bacterium]
MTKEFFTNQQAKILALIVLALGALIRIKVYFENRSLFLDEANLARNIVERPIRGFFALLDYQQYAPPLFLSMVKGTIGVFGPSEMGLRFIPLLASLGSLYMIYRLSAKWITAAWPRLIPLFLTTFSYDMIRYGTECKQYSVDVFLFLSLILLATRWQPATINRYQILIWAGLGTISIWLSMPIIFCLAGIGLYYGLSFLRTQKYELLLPLVGAIILWLASFGSYYFLLLLPDIESEYLNTYHQDYFLPLLPTSPSDWTKWSGLILSLFRITSGYTVFAYLVAIPIFLVGCYSLFRKKDFSAWLLLTPIVTCLVASGFQQYSLIPRLVLFLIPMLALIMGLGTSYLVDGKSWRLGVALVLWLPVLPLTGGLAYVVSPLTIESTRSILEQTQTHPKGEATYIHHEAVPASIFYRDYHPDSMAFRQKPLYLGHWDETPDTLITSGVSSFWVLHSHLINAHSSSERDRDLERIAPYGFLSDTLSSPGAQAVLWRERLVNTKEKTHE